jgi:hypothetical protein
MTATLDVIMLTHCLIKYWSPSRQIKLPEINTRLPEMHTRSPTTLDPGRTGIWKNDTEVSNHEKEND